MKRLFVGIVFIAIATSLLGGVSALYSDTEWALSQSEAGLLELYIEGGALSQPLMSPGVPVVFPVTIKNVGTIPLHFHVSAYVSGHLADVVEITPIPDNNLPPGGFTTVPVEFSLPENVHSRVKGKTGELHVTVRADQTGDTVGFTDEKTVVVPIQAAAPAPRIMIVKPKEGEVCDEILIKAHYKDSFSNGKVTFSLDSFLTETEMFNEYGKMYTYILDTNLYPNGPYTLYVKGVDAIGQEAIDSVDIEICN